MDRPKLHIPAPDDDALERAIIEIDAAIELVAAGAARRVTLSGVFGVAEVAGIAAAHAQDAAVDFRVQATAQDTVVVGPRTSLIAVPGAAAT